MVQTQNSSDSPWWSTFFSGLVLDMVRYFEVMLPTGAEVDFLEKVLGAPPGARILDVPCGAGRHSIDLASRGYRVTGYDLAPELIADARAAARKRGLEASFEMREMRDIPFQGELDGIVCLGNSFGYLDDAGNEAFLAASARALRPGGRIVIDGSALLDCLLPQFVERNWFPIGEAMMLRNVRLDHRSGRMDGEYTMISGTTIERKKSSQRTYTFRELSLLLEAAGFTEVESYGSLAVEPFRFGMRALFVVARKS